MANGSYKQKGRKKRMKTDVGGLQTTNGEQAVMEAIQH